MNKQAARELVWAQTLTFGDLRRAILAGREQGGRSLLNGQLTKVQAADIFEACFAARRPDDEVIKTRKHDPYKRREVLSRDGLIAENIVREFL